MPLYLTRFSYTPATWTAMIHHPEDRRVVVGQYVKDVGGQLYGYWYALGDHSAYCLWEAPDHVAMASISLAVASRGGLSEHYTTVLLSVDETIEALRRAGTMSYRAPGD